MFRTQTFNFLLLIFTIVNFSCNKPPVPDTAKENILNLPDRPFDYSKKVGDIFSNNNSFNFDRPANREIELGRILFYDKRLSIDNTTSCASCHIQQNAFASNVAFSKSFNNSFTKRNTLPVFNYFWRANKLLWEGTNVNSTNLYSTEFNALDKHINMGINEIGYLENKLSLIEYYSELFEDVYDGNLTQRNIRKSLALFLIALVSSESKYDKAYENDFENFSALEKTGLKLYFKAGCNGCHDLEKDQDLLLDLFGTAELYNMYDNNKTLGRKGENIANNGLDLVYDDEGAGMGRFRIPNLRNIALTAPYMHDGRFNTLNEVIEHYNTDVKPHPNLDDRLTGRANFYEGATPNTNYYDPIRFNFSDADKKALIAFLNTLTDEEIVTSPLYSNPFKE